MGGYIGQKPTAVPLTSADIEDGVISAADLGANSVDSSELVDGSIDTSHLGNLQVTTAKLAADAIDSTKLADDAVGAEHIADNAVGLAALASGTDGNIISYDASGNPVAIATGSDGQVLTSAGAGQPPAFESVSAGTALTGSTNNTIPTVTGANAISGEANLTFDGTYLKVKDPTQAKYTTINTPDGLTRIEATDDMTFYTDSTNRLQIYKTSGNISVLTGNLAFGTSGKGIDFSATADSSGTNQSEILNDYEKGTWTATFVLGSGSASVRSDSETCGYTKIGRLVHVQGAIVGTSVSSAGGTLKFGGLPFAADSGSGDMADRTVGSVLPWAITGTLRYPVAFVEANVTAINIQDGESRTNNEGDHVNNDGEWRFSIDYQAAEL